MSAISTRRNPGALLTKATAPLPTGGDEAILTDLLLPGHGRTFVDEADEADEVGLLDVDSAELIPDDLTMPVIPRRADEFTCSKCFLILHISRLAMADDGHPACTDCV